MKRLLASVRAGWARLRRVDPSRLTYVWAVVVATAATQGIAVPLDFDNRVRGFLAVLTVLLPLVQGETNRAQVYSPASVDKIAQKAAELSGAISTGRAARIAVDMVKAKSSGDLTPSSAITPRRQPYADALDDSPATPPAVVEDALDEGEPSPRHLR